MDITFDAILFDIGGTLRFSTPRKPQERAARVAKIMELIGAAGSPEAFVELLLDRARAYKTWSEETMVELDEAALWTSWFLPDLPAEKIRPLAVELNTIWRDSLVSFELLPETREVITELFRRGYRLGLVSNTTSSVEAVETFHEAHLSGYFETFILSCKYGRRKPDPSILIHAVDRMGIRPERCAYIGDRPDRDVVASRKAGFGMAIIRRDRTRLSYPIDGNLAPDRVIDNLKELLDLFPSREKQRAQAHAGRVGRTSEIDPPAWEASLSTMWCFKNFLNLEDSFIAAGRMGFSGIELNHQLNSTLLRGIDLRRYPVASIHEPCPADVSTTELKARDWLISSTDEICRGQGVAAIRKSIDLAAELGVKDLVVHSGYVGDDLPSERELIRLYRGGQRDTPIFAALREELKNQRAALAEPRMDAVVKSVKELLEYAGRFGVRLGLENRYHIADIPIPDELARLLELAEADRLGFIYDVGHGQTLDVLGFFPHLEWLERFSERIFGVHLHDVRGVTDHFAPGLGEVDFAEIAPFIPAAAFRTCEVKPENTPEQVQAGMDLLYRKGCVRCL